MEDKLRIRPFNELIGSHFFIPRYQRGYRWGKQEITDLLGDILQYSIRIKAKSKVGKFYCLQPIVVKPKIWVTDNNETRNGWELIDGQQRLTTLFIILTYLEDIRQFHDNRKEIYSIDFETREDCISFFKEKRFVESIDTSNVDFYHISKAYSYIQEWFKDKPTIRLDIIKRILGEEDNVSIIWYEADENNDDSDSSIELFTRLNEGKIPLTDAELIKALLLQGDNYQDTEQKIIKQRLFEIASEWDTIEASLQDEKFWLFLNDTEYNPSSHIQFIFKLLSKEWNKDKCLITYEEIDGKPKHYEYLVFDRYLTLKREEFEKNNDTKKEAIDPVNEIWKEIKDIYSILFEWYSDHTLFHYIGFLLAVDTRKNIDIIEDLISNTSTKIAFLDSIKLKIASLIEIKQKKDKSNDVKLLSELIYPKNNPELIKILLLFNIEELIVSKKEDARFPFHLYKKDKITSLEHIHPQNPENIDKDEQRCITWLGTHKISLSHLVSSFVEKFNQINELIDRIDILLLSFNIEKFKEVYSETIELYSEVSEIKDSDMHKIYNMALVDKDTNSSLNNSFFDIKRKILKENKSGKYIPIATQRAFSKHYSSNPTEMIFWSQSDRKSYFESIKKVYDNFMDLKKVDDGK